MIRIKKKYIKWQILFLVLLMQYAIQSILGINAISNMILYIDEFLTVVCILLCIKHYPMIKRRQDFELIFLLSILCIDGLISNIINSKQETLAVLVDLLSCIKCFAAYLAIRICIKKDGEKILYALNGLCKILSAFLFGLDVINMFVVQIFSFGDYRYFMHSQKLFFSHPAQLSGASILILIILLHNSRIFKNDFFMFLISLVILSTLRTKDIAAVVAIWLLYIYFVKARIKSKGLFVLLCITTVAFLGIDQYSLYYGNIEQARATLMDTSLILGKKMFPLGTGFGTFGTSMSAKYYSPVYALYHINTVWGLSESYPVFISDTFWPAIIGQFGFGGMLIYLFIVIYFIKKCIRVTFYNKYFFCTTFGILLYEIIASLGSSAFFHVNAFVLFSILAITVNEAENTLIFKNKNLEGKTWKTK